MDVHYIWIGGSEISPPYLANYQKCVRLNPLFRFKIWKNEECLQLVEEYGLMETFISLTFICKCNFLKYLILHKFGGIYTDFDIKWKQPFSKIINDYRFPSVDVILTQVHEGWIDDPFIISKPNIFGGCITYCKNRTNLKMDGELLINTGKKEIHRLEPFGPFGLTEWLRHNKINFSYFNQQDLLDHKGFFGVHDQRSTWKAK